MNVFVLTDKKNNTVLEIPTAACPKTWKRIQGSCYKFSSVRKTWLKAKSACENKGSKLAVVNSKAKLQALAQEVRRSSWIGLQRNKDNISVWLWVDGSRANYTYWNTDEPNNLDIEHCVHMYSYTGKWNNLNCDSLLHYVCEINGKINSENFIFR